MTLTGAPRVPGAPEGPAGPDSPWRKTQKHQQHTLSSEQWVQIDVKHYNRNTEIRQQGI